MAAVYDRLANPRLLDWADSAAERIYVGKEPKRHALKQHEINALLVEKALAGKNVCRLKGGDPFVFGRGGEEAEALIAAGIEWEYVAGVTSAIAVPAYAGIPVTHRGYGSTLTIVTGHEDPEKEETSLRWDVLAKGSDTLVFMMGVTRLDRLTARLIEHGRAPETPAAVVSWGTYPRQRTVTGTLADLTDRAAAAGIEPPGVTVIGEVAALRERLRWWDEGPLFGKRIAVTRARDQAADMVERLEREGAEVVLCPTIRIQRLPDADLSSLERPYDWVVFTSANGVAALAETLRERHQDLRVLGRAKIAAIGPETARAAERHGLWVDYVPPRYVAESVAEAFPEAVFGKRLLIPRAKEAREVLPDLWRAAGATVDVVPVYETLPDLDGIERLRGRIAEGALDIVTFTASSTVKNLLKGITAESLRSLTLAAIGPITAATLREAGLEPKVEAEEHTVEGLVTALREAFLDQRS